MTVDQFNTVLQILPQVVASLEEKGENIALPDFSGEPIKKPDPEVSEEDDEEDTNSAEDNEDEDAED